MTAWWGPARSRLPEIRSIPVLQATIPLTAVRSPVDVEVVIPAFNESSRLPMTLAAMVAFLGGRSWLSRVVVVDNGSVDGTAAAARALGTGDVQVVDVIGCARPARARRSAAGSWHQQLPLVGFFDADLATPLDTLEPAIAALAAALPRRSPPGTSRLHLRGAQPLAAASAARCSAPCPARWSPACRHAVRLQVLPPPRGRRRRSPAPGTPASPSTWSCCTDPVARRPDRRDPRGLDRRPRLDAPPRPRRARRHRGRQPHAPPHRTGRPAPTGRPLSATGRRPRPAPARRPPHPSAHPAGRDADPAPQLARHHPPRPAVRSPTSTDRRRWVEAGAEVTADRPTAGCRRRRDRRRDRHPPRRRYVLVYLRTAARLRRRAPVRLRRRLPERHPVLRPAVHHDTVGAPGAPRAPGPVHRAVPRRVRRPGPPARGPGAAAGLRAAAHRRRLPLDPRQEMRSRLGFDGIIDVVPNGLTPPAEPTSIGAARPGPDCRRWSSSAGWYRTSGSTCCCGRPLPAAPGVPRSGSRSSATAPSSTRCAGSRPSLDLGATSSPSTAAARHARDALCDRAWLTTSTSAAEGWGQTVLEAAATGFRPPRCACRAMRDSVVTVAPAGWSERRRRFAQTLVAALTELSDDRARPRGHRGVPPAWAAASTGTAGRAAGRDRAVVDAVGRTGPGALRTPRRRTRSDTTSVARFTHADPAAAAARCGSPTRSRRRHDRHRCPARVRRRRSARPARTHRRRRHRGAPGRPPELLGGPASIGDLAARPAGGSGIPVQRGAVLRETG